MRVALADPPDIKTPWLIANHPNLGVLYLASTLRQRVPGVEILYLESHISLHEHLHRLRDFRPQLYGMSFASLRLPEAEVALRKVREMHPGIPIICGGPHPTVRPRELLEQLPVDVCVRGEGEQTLLELVQAYLAEKPLHAIPGIMFREGDRICETPPRPLVRDLDAIAFPSWDLVDFSRYTGNYQYRGSPSTALIASRGCPYDCVFCANPVWKLAKPYIRMRSPANIVSEVEWLHRLGIREISIRSDEFNPHLPWTLAVCRELAAAALPGMFFQANLRVDKVTDELAVALKQANFWLVQIGIESGNQRTLDGVGKHITLNQVVEACRCLKRHGLSVYGYIMMFHVWEEGKRLCYETPDDVNRTFDFVRRLKRERLLDYISFSTTTPMPGSRLYEIAERHGILRAGPQPRDLADLHMQLQGVGSRDLKRARRQGIRLQLSINLGSRRNNLLDWRKNWHKLKTLARSL